MPTYMVFSAPGALSEEQERRVAEAITDAHARSTGAPRYYVQVILGAGDNCRRFVGGKPAQRQLWIRGDIRAGRTEEQLRDLLLTMMGEVARAAEMDEEDIWIDLNEVEPAAILKFRTVFPPAGREKEWEENLPQSLRERLNAAPR